MGDTIALSFNEGNVPENFKCHAPRSMAALGLMAIAVTSHRRSMAAPGLMATEVTSNLGSMATPEAMATAVSTPGKSPAGRYYRRGHNA